MQAKGRLLLTLELKKKKVFFRIDVSKKKTSYTFALFSGQREKLELAVKTFLLSRD